MQLYRLSLQRICCITSVIFANHHDTTKGDMTFCKMLSYHFVFFLWTWKMKAQHRVNLKRANQWSVFVQNNTTWAINWGTLKVAWMLWKTMTRSPWMSHKTVCYYVKQAPRTPHKLLRLTREIACCDKSSIVFGMKRHLRNISNITFIIHPNLPILQSANNVKKQLHLVKNNKNRTHNAPC